MGLCITQNIYIYIKVTKLQDTITQILYVKIQVTKVTRLQIALKPTR